MSTRLRSAGWVFVLGLVGCTSAQVAQERAQERLEAFDPVPEAPIVARENEYFQPRPPAKTARQPANLVADLVTLSQDKVRCVTISEVGQNRRVDCTYDTPNGSKKIHVLTLSGTFAENAYHHGKFLAREIHEGSLVEALQNIENLKKKMSPLAKQAFEGLYGCFESKMMRSASDEFKEGVRSLHRGYAEVMGQQAVTEEELLRATFSIEMGNFLGGVIHRMQENLVKKVGTIAKIVVECGVPIAAHVVGELDEIAIEKGMLREKFACTGLVTTRDWTADGEHIHARNLEQSSMINSWNRHPTIFLMDEKNDVVKGEDVKINRPFQKYVGFGTAGLIFPGGISGFNEKGIAVSLHQFGTTFVDAEHRRGRAAMMPYLQQRILREATSLDEAIALIQQTKVYSGWTIFVSDAARKEVASIEITPKSAVVARRGTGYMVQTNLFLSKGKQREHFHNRYNNLLENYSRQKVAEGVLHQSHRKIDLARTVNLLSSHQDYFERGDRAFGRSVARVSNIMTSIVIPRPESAGGEAWMTIADQLPPIHGYYAGFDVDFQRLTLSPKIAVKTGAYGNFENRERSFERYHQAYIAHTKGDDKKSKELLVEALRLSQKDGIDDPVFRYILGRLHLNEGNPELALPYFQSVAQFSENLHPLRRANLEMYEMRARDLIGGDQMLPNAERDRRYRFAVDTVEAIRKNRDEKWIPKIHGYVHAKKDLKKKLKMWKAIHERKTDSNKSGKLEKIELQDVDMGTVD